MNAPIALTPALPPGVTLTAPVRADALALLSPRALAFVAALERRYRAGRRHLLARRRERQAALDAGARPDFLPETEAIRAADWRIAPVPADLQDRRVEITGPVERKMVINALNSGANAFMADFEDSLAPSWDNLLAGQRNLHDAVRGAISHTDPQSGKAYRLNAHTAVLIVRPRGWHLDEVHMLVDGEPVSGSLFDFGLYFFHNAQELLSRGSGPYFYLPKIENHVEARLWNLVFETAQAELGLPRGTIKATVLIETILAAFEMDEILWELRDHIAGLNCGRWDYIFSVIKKFRNRPDFVLPDRAQVGMTQPFLRAYSLRLIQTCHRRGAHAMGGMAAQIPIKGDPAANDAALARVRADKEREAGDGHDGTWVAHPGLVTVAKEVFDRLMPAPNQIDKRRDDVTVTAADLLAVPAASITEGGLRQNLSVGVQYTAAWFAGLGCVPIDNLMEDAATAEISRAQLWQWRRHGAQMADGRRVDETLIRTLLGEEMARLSGQNTPRPFTPAHLQAAGALFLDLVLAPEFTEFLTLPAYARMVADETSQQDRP